MLTRPRPEAPSPDSSFLDLPIFLGAIALGLALFTHARRSVFAHVLGAALVGIGVAALVRLAWATPAKPRRVGSRATPSDGSIDGPPRYRHHHGRRTATGRGGVSRDRSS